MSADLLQSHGEKSEKKSRKKSAKKSRKKSRQKKLSAKFEWHLLGSVAKGTSGYYEVVFITLTTIITKFSLNP